MKIALALLISTLVFSITSFAAGSKEELARQAASSDAAVAQSATTELRTMGPEGLDALFATYSPEIKSFSDTGKRTEN
jgi:hypothetical protein